MNVKCSKGTYRFVYDRKLGMYWLSERGEDVPLTLVEAGQSTTTSGCRA